MSTKNKNTDRNISDVLSLGQYSLHAILDSLSETKESIDILGHHLIKQVQNVKDEVSELKDQLNDQRDFHLEQLGNQFMSDQIMIKSLSEKYRNLIREQLFEQIAAQELLVKDRAERLKAALKEVKDLLANVA